MTTASHYVFMDLEEMIKNGKYSKLHEISEKYSDRYNEDNELQTICDKIINSLATENQQELENIKKDLQQLINTRKMQTGGGSRLWFEDRR
ncbi:MAG: hypothetical protein B6U97_02155 [Candidatus Altiarchaeales archaeon ex4484_96]|nr:MAG: hypothetical protein B6U97_02155 [Candidatus Altiarchaeales archaeon ex4484_96]